MPQIVDNCPHCGKRLTRSQARFCTNCGTPLSGAQDALVTVHGGSLAKIVVHQPDTETREEFLSKPVTTLGRRSSNMIQLLSPIVSGEHARLELTRQGHTITDLASTNGTYVNGKLLTPRLPHLLASNDIIRFSDTMGNSTWLTYIAPSGFVDVDKTDIGRVFVLKNSLAYVGRNPQAAIRLSHPAISWNHARVIRRSEQEYVIEDLSSNNGTFVNGSQLRQRRRLERGDVIQIGPFNLVYRDAGTFASFSAERNFRLEGVDLEKVVYNTTWLGWQPTPVTILQKVNIVVNPREFIAVVGGSGTGKSTLLKALSGLGRASRGAVLINGDDLYHNFDLYRNMLGYVPQDDIIHHNLEVRRAIQYAAHLRLPDAGPAEIENRIDEVLGKVGLSGQVGTLVRDLSGGQRKRVSIAAELLAEPWIFFLDEPTSGLDPGLEKLMMDTLRQLADEGRTIILVTHATANIALQCDQVAFMVRGGELAFFGPPDQALKFFNANDFPDIYTRLSQNFAPAQDLNVPVEIRPTYEQQAKASPPGSEIPAGALWAEHYRTSPLYQRYVAQRQTGEVARPLHSTVRGASSSPSKQFNQFKVLAQRYLDLIRHDRLSLLVLLVVMPVIGLFLLLISEGSALTGQTAAEIEASLASEGIYTVADKAQTLLFMLALSANLLGVFAAAYEIIKEEAIYRRERLVNLKTLPYFASKFGVLALFMILQCLLLLLILSLNIDFPTTGAILWAPLEYYFTLVFTALASVALGLFLSALASSRDMVIYLVLIVLFVQIVFSGAVFELSGLTQPLSWLTITRWSLEALGTSTDMAGLNNLGQVRVEREVDFGRGIQKVVDDAPTTIEFYVNYRHSGLALLSRWIFLWLHTLLWGGLALWLIKRKDEI